MIKAVDYWYINQVLASFNGWSSNPRKKVMAALLIYSMQNFGTKELTCLGSLVACVLVKHNVLFCAFYVSKRKVENIFLVEMQ